ncbi:MAG: hypothetical protein WDW36_008710 [Sanguina aurantia]
MIMEDATLLLPLSAPVTEVLKQASVWKIGRLTFRSDFDSGNLQDVKPGNSSTEVLLWTARDGQSTGNERGTRSWFYFGVSGHMAGADLTVTIMNLNKQGKLYSQDYRPCYWYAGMTEWLPISSKVAYSREDDDFQLRFRVHLAAETEVFLAFAIPFSYRDTQCLLAHLDRTFAASSSSSSSSRGDASSSLTPASEHHHHRDLAGVTGAASARGVTSTTHTNTSSSTSSSSSNGNGDGKTGRGKGSVKRSSVPGGGWDRKNSKESDGGSAAAAAAAAGSRHALPGSAGSSSHGNSSGTPGAVSITAAVASAVSKRTEDLDARIYYRRQLLTRSLEGRRVELITITDAFGATDDPEVLTGGVCECRGLEPPAAVFPSKKIFFVSSRVHPGETPASHMFNGLLVFLLRKDDPRAAAARRQFVFKLVPLVNPDGVFHGNYRTDTLGQNLNRFYTGDTDPELQPSVYAIKHLLLSYAAAGSLEFYLDLHAHANKKGVFAFGNALEGEAHLQSLLFCRLIAINSPRLRLLVGAATCWPCSAAVIRTCNFTERNMSCPDKDGSSREGAGRVALFRSTGLTHLYTIEANYNTARMLNASCPLAGDPSVCSSPTLSRRSPPKFTTAVLHSVGRSFVTAALDLHGCNPHSRLANSAFRSLEGVRNWLLSELKSPPETRTANLPAMSEASVGSTKGLYTAAVMSRAVGRRPSTSAFGRGCNPGGEPTIQIYEPVSRRGPAGAPSGAARAIATAPTSSHLEASGTPHFPPPQRSATQQPQGTILTASSWPAPVDGVCSVSDPVRGCRRESERGDATEASEEVSLADPGVAVDAEVAAPTGATVELAAAESDAEGDPPQCQHACQPALHLSGSNGSSCGGGVGGAASPLLSFIKQCGSQSSNSLCGGAVVMSGPAQHNQTFAGYMSSRPRSRNDPLTDAGSVGDSDQDDVPQQPQGHLHSPPPACPPPTLATPPLLTSHWRTLPFPSEGAHPIPTPARALDQPQPMPLNASTTNNHKTTVNHNGSGNSPGSHGSSNGGSGGNGNGININGSSRGANMLGAQGQLALSPYGVYVPGHVLATVRALQAADAVLSSASVLTPQMSASALWSSAPATAGQASGSVLRKRVGGGHGKSGSVGEGGRNGWM